MNNFNEKKPLTNNSANNQETPAKKSEVVASPRSRFNFSNNRLSAPEPPEITPPPSPPAPRHNKRVGQFSRGKALLDEERSPLVFNVAQLMRDYEGSTREYEVEADELNLDEEDNQFARNIVGHIRFTKVRHDILVQGPFRADINMICVRCLEDFVAPVEIELEEMFKPSIDIGTGLPVGIDEDEDEDDEDNLRIDPNHMLNLSEALRQQFLVSLPMHPLCREDCPGLYTYVEAANADVPAAEEEAETQDEDEPVDKRWSALSQLLKKDE